LFCLNLPRSRPSPKDPVGNRRNVEPLDPRRTPHASAWSYSFAGHDCTAEVIALRPRVVSDSFVFDAAFTY